MYHHQQVQTALYQQQQIEFAQQQAQLEMHLQLEQMRLQNLALQEQIMIGQAQAQAQAEQQLHNTFYSTNKAPVSNRLNFTHAQGGLLAERALARRQQAEADALYAQCYPNLDEEDDVLRELGRAPQYSISSDHSSNLTPPAVVVSKPDEAFPLLALVDTPSAKSLGNSKLDERNSENRLFSQVTDPASNVGSPNSAQLAKNNNPSVAAPLAKKKFSDVVKASPPPSSKTTLPNPVNSTANPATAPKLNPFSSVFVPSSNTGSENEATSVAPNVNTSSPPSKTVSFTEPEPQQTSPTTSGIYRAVQSKSPPTNKAARTTPASMTPTIQATVGATPTRQPRGPAAEAELTNQNFATRIRKRAIGAIKTLGTRPASSPSPLSVASSANMQHYQQQQMLEALMMQQHQQQALAAAGYLNSNAGFYPNMASGGIAQLMATARAREERFGY